MGRTLLAVVAGLLAWLAVATLVGLCLRLWPAYVAAAPQYDFTLEMLWARLAIGAVSTLAAGWVAAAVDGRGRRAVWAVGVALLVLFLPEHYQLRHRFPLWYHLVFLVSLVPLTWIGGTMRRRPV